MKWFSRAADTGKFAAITQTLNELQSDGLTLSIEELLRYQSKTSLIDLKASRNQQSRMSGNYLSRSKGRGMEFDEVRHYQHGDDIRAIDWRVTARTGKTHTKLYREEIERPVLVATDLSTSMLFGSQLLCKSVQAAHIAALVAWHAKARGDRLGGMVFNETSHQECKPRSRKQGVLHYLHHLVTMHAASFANQQALAARDFVSAFADNCQRLRQLAKPGSLVYLITDGHAIGSESVRHLSQLSRHCELIVCLITDPLEMALPSSDQRLNVAMTDGEQRQQVTLGDQHAAQNYQSKVDGLMAARKQLFRQAGARLLILSAGESLEQQLIDGAHQWIR
ncbi:DUF58 domain-containing protein [Thalassotalea euphylliae]|uniref:DUF58 domain-containing protein n=1 Tax=Thalassotalea euphylliae TaxID=1655234 RepID=A0A3E0U0E3_9GAMM|nr:DUF58 domain-containing protein [Thalassotalea euphylliae]REL30160.1 DUF58 domain-containing protein [Thalassotalea euphylliae]